MARLLLVQNLFVEQFGVMTLSAVAKSEGHEVAVAIGSDDHIITGGLHGDITVLKIVCFILDCI